MGSNCVRRGTPFDETDSGMMAVVTAVRLLVRLFTSEVARPGTLLDKVGGITSGRPSELESRLS